MEDILVTERYNKGETIITVILYEKHKHQSGL